MIGGDEAVPTDVMNVISGGISLLTEGQFLFYSYTYFRMWMVSKEETLFAPSCPYCHLPTG